MTEDTPRGEDPRGLDALLARGAPATEIIAAATLAAGIDRNLAKEEPILAECVRLLAMVPQAAQADDFRHSLRRLGVEISSESGLGEIKLALGRRLDGFGSGTSFDEACRLAFLETISAGIGSAFADPDGATQDQWRSAAAKLATAANFARLCRVYFGRVLEELLSSFLDRSHSSLDGPGQRFAHAGAREDIDRALCQHCFYATEIITEFSTAWRDRTMSRDGAIDHEAAWRYGVVAFGLVLEELPRAERTQITWGYFTKALKHRPSERTYKLFPLELATYELNDKPAFKVVGLGEVRGAHARIVHSLEEYHRKDLDNGLRSDSHRFIPTGELAEIASTTKETVHQHVKRCRDKLADYYAAIEGRPPPTPLLIEGGNPRGYRLDPDCRVIPMSALPDD